MAGCAFSLLHAYASINLKADQVISGTAINLLAPAVTIFLARTLTGSQNISIVKGVSRFDAPVLSNIPVIGPLFFSKMYLTTFIVLGLVILTWYIVFKTSFGLRLRACGEHPQAADSVGINVYKMRYFGVAISGALAGIGGLVFVIPTSTNFNATVAGYGFLALAVLIFGQWKPIRILYAAFFFGLMKTLASAYSGIPILSNLPISNSVYKMIPYITTIIVLAFTSKNSQAPKASGLPYDKSVR